MKFILKTFTILSVFLLCLKAVAAPQTNAVDESLIRQKLVQTILSSGEVQRKLLNELGDTGSKLVNDTLQSWTRGEIYLYDGPDGSKIPVLLEDQQDADGKARAIRIVDGQFVKDASGKELRFDDSDLNAADTDIRLRSSI